MTQNFDRYFLAQPNGFTHKALQAMEAAGDEILKRLLP